MNNHELSGICWVKPTGKHSWIVDSQYNESCCGNNDWQLLCVSNIGQAAGLGHWPPKLMMLLLSTKLKNKTAHGFVKQKPVAWDWWCIWCSIFLGPLMNTLRWSPYDLYTASHTCYHVLEQGKHMRNPRPTPSTCPFINKLCTLTPATGLASSKQFITLEDFPVQQLIL